MLNYKTAHYFDGNTYMVGYIGYSIALLYLNQDRCLLIIDTKRGLLCQYSCTKYLPIWNMIYVHVCIYHVIRVNINHITQTWYIYLYIICSVYDIWSPRSLNLEIGTLKFKNSTVKTQELYVYQSGVVILCNCFSTWLTQSEWIFTLFQYNCFP